MCFSLRLCLFLLSVLRGDGLNVYHIKSRVSLHSESKNGYFGYSLAMTKSSLFVGAPKAMNSLNVKSGEVYSCPLNRLIARNISCEPLKKNDKSYSMFTVSPNSYFRDDMWFGASLVLLSDDKILICAPRWAKPYVSRNDQHILANGMCYVHSQNFVHDLVLTPLTEGSRQAYIGRGDRGEYGEYGSHLNYYAHGQAGLSAARVSGLGWHYAVIGAPGLLQWAGGVIDYKYLPDVNRPFFSRQPIANPYFTNELGPDDYFGYSVDAGVFQINGKRVILYIGGAPRSKTGLGQVLVFEPAQLETEALRVHAAVRGPQLGSYFGACLCVTDLDADGQPDLLVGAPNYVVTRDSYDQGGVFVYLSRNGSAKLSLLEAGWVSGSGGGGARFGSAIAALGDVDGDGHGDIAVGAPWENDGVGAVYIFKGSKDGLRTRYAQRITEDNARGFGMSVASGVDVDNNNCNELAVGAHGSDAALVFRCVPTARARAQVRVPDALDLPRNATELVVLLCVHVAPSRLWKDISIHIRANITVDEVYRRAVVQGPQSYNVVAKPGSENCEEVTINIKSEADLSRPLTIKYELEDASTFSDDSYDFDASAGGISEDSELISSLTLQLTRGCGEDLICKPWLEMSLEPLERSTYVPGSGDTLGITLKVFNKDEPSFGAKVNLELPLPPIRVPSACSFNDMNLTCTLPSPFYKEDFVTWNIEMDYLLNTTKEVDLISRAVLYDPFYAGNITDTAVKQVVHRVKPQAKFSVSGQSLPDVWFNVTRQKFNAVGNVTLVHYYEIINFGPSDWHDLEAQILLPKKVHLSSPIKGCRQLGNSLACVWSVAAKLAYPVVVTLRVALTDFGEVLDKDTMMNISSSAILIGHNKFANVTSTLILEPPMPVWPFILAAALGIIILTAISSILRKCGFFSREKRQQLHRLKQGAGAGAGVVGAGVPDTDAGAEVDESSQELLSLSEDESS